MQNSRPLSVVIIARNEAERIEECLKSVVWAEEIIVVDSGSTDNTRDIALRYTDKFFEIPWRGFGPQKQAAVELAAHDTIFSIDCDERVTNELAEEIRAILATKTMLPCYSVPRKTFIGRKEIRWSGWYPDRTIRLFDRTIANFSDNQVHERVVGPTDAAGHCKGDLLHFSFKGMTDMLAKLNSYTDIAAQEMFARGKRTTPVHVTLRPLWTFFRTYVIYLGILDGYEGLEIALANAVTVFYKYAKLRELTVNARKDA